MQTVFDKSAEKQREQSSSNEAVLQLVSFTLGKEEFGIDILRVQEINRTSSVTRVPNAPHFIEGVINLRGKVIPIVDLRKRFGMPPSQHDKNTRIIVVEILSKTVGFIVDSVREVLRIPQSVVDPPPPIIAGISSDYIEGVGKMDDRLLILLNLEKALSASELQAL
ncbi:MAG: chemotaxis protein CheW [Bacteroidota bacterium]|nr:chemotaxis protein CheW [Candidatus Kapabacteria bacterium]MDW8219407.1 chemotaxis protein CheW [Bacteroidota bacterium]